MKFILNNTYHVDCLSAKSININQSMEDGEECNNQPDGSAGLLNGRPLKKAKYAWQVKRGRSQSTLHISADEDDDTKVSDVKNLASTSMDDRLRAVALHDCGVTTPSPSSLGYSRPTVDQGPECKPFRNAPVHPTCVLHRWQSKQIAQGIIDNAINNVLGDIGGMESLSRNNSYNAAVDAAYDQVDPLTWGQYLSSQNIVNEGVAEAIRQQGLQRWHHVQIQEGTTTASDSSPLPDISNVINCTTFTVQENQYNSEAVIENAGRLESDDLLAKAVNCAISRKGLSMLVVMPQQ